VIGACARATVATTMARMTARTFKRRAVRARVIRIVVLPLD
jgi:hypothetical protein